MLVVYMLIPIQKYSKQDMDILGYNNYNVHNEEIGKKTCSINYANRFRDFPSNKLLVMCDFQDRASSIITPKNIVSFTLSIVV